MPFLWGRLLDFDILAQFTGDRYWWKELVRRAGNSVLWIKRRNPPAEKVNLIQPLALRLLKTVQDNLHRRFQILVVNLDRLEYRIDKVSWNEIGSCPVPHLRCFDLSVTYGFGPYRWPEKFFHPSSPFADNAPCLREFRAAQFRVNLQASWASGLRDLYIGYHHRLEDIFDALSTTESLERLQLRHIYLTDDLHLKTVRLLKLKELRFHTLYPICDALLDHLIIAADCALHYTLRIPPQWSYANENNDFDVTLPVILRRLSKYAQGYFLHRVPTDLLVHYEDQTLSITAHTQDDSTGFHFRIVSPWTYTKANTAAFLGEFTLPEFIHVTELHLEIELFENFHKTGLISPFLSCFSSVQVLTTCCWDPYFFKYLKKKLGLPRSLLPSLRTIKIQKPMPRIDEPTYYHMVLLPDFIGSLEGYPVEIIFSP